MWCRSHDDFFEDLQGTEVNVFLSDPNNEAVVAELERRFENYTQYAVRMWLMDTVGDFGEVRDKGKGQSSVAVNVWFVPYAPAYTLFRCDDTFVFATYRHRPYGDEGTVPAFVFGPGSMHDFFERGSRT